MVTLTLRLAWLVFALTACAETEKQNAPKPWKAFFSKKNYSASINDSIRLFSSTLSAGPAGAVNVALSDPAVLLSTAGDEYVFLSGKAGAFQIFFSSRSLGSLLTDTLTITITDLPPALTIGAAFVMAMINEPFSLNMDVTDDGQSCKIIVDMDGDGKADTTYYNKANPSLCFNKPTRTGEKEKTFTCRIAVVDNDSHTVSDSAVLQILYNPPRADAGSSIIACPDELVLFSGKKSRDQNGRIIKYLWDFSADGKVDTMLEKPEVEEAFTAKGDFSVILRVMDNDGNVSTPDTVIVSVYKDKPLASVNAVHEVKQGESISFIGTGNVNCGIIEKYCWDFDDNGKWEFTSRSHGRASFTYGSIGSFLARFMVVDNTGDSTFLTWPVRVHP